MKARHGPRMLLIATALLGLGGAGWYAYGRGRPLPLPTRQHLFRGVEYERKVQWAPRPMIIHVIKVDTRTSGLRFVVTPPDAPGTDKPLRARTTSEFLREYGVQVAINGDGFSPWWSHSPADYYPHAGDAVQPRGEAVSRGKAYWSSTANFPTLYMSRRNALSFEAPAKPYNAISGEFMLVSGGTPVQGLDTTALHPRTAVGYSRNGRYLYLVVVDGRQPFYSEGTTLPELANLMISLGAQYAMNLDGGGSSTMVVQDPEGQPRVLNSPIDSYIPGRERPVANHLGIFTSE